MRIPNAAHTSRPWRIHELTGDFRLEDVWVLPGRGGPDDLPRAVELITAYDPAHSASFPVQALFAIRWKLCGLFGWDDPDDGIGGTVPALRDRLPSDLREAPRPAFEELPFTSLYLLSDEWAAEIANRAMHGILHLGWVPAAAGGYGAEMAVYVRPNGRFGQAYMAAIRPFRHLVVYPSILREYGQRWNAGTEQPST